MLKGNRLRAVVIRGISSRHRLARAAFMFLSATFRMAAGSPLNVNTKSSWYGNQNSNFT